MHPDETTKPRAETTNMLLRACSPDLWRRCRYHTVFKIEDCMHHAVTWASPCLYVHTWAADIWVPPYISLRRESKLVFVSTVPSNNAAFTVVCNRDNQWHMNTKQLKSIWTINPDFQVKKAPRIFFEGTSKMLEILITEVHTFNCI